MKLCNLIEKRCVKCGWTTSMLQGEKYNRCGCGGNLVRMTQRGNGN